MARPVLKCIFCGGLNLTKEHVFPRWSHRFMSPRVPGRALSRIGSEYPDKVIARDVKLRGLVRDWQVKCVCGGLKETCNSGWMSQLETKVRPIFIPLIKGEKTRLSPADQSLIATWAVLKVMVANFSSEDRVLTHHKQRKYLMKHKLPPNNGWGVWIGNFDRKTWPTEWISRPFLVLPPERVAKYSDRRATHFNSNATTQVIGKLFIHVVHTPHPRLVTAFRFATPRHGSLIRIWPQNSAYSIAWPLGFLTEADADRIPGEIIDFLLNIQRKADPDT